MDPGRFKPCLDLTYNVRSVSKIITVMNGRVIHINIPLSMTQFACKIVVAVILQCYITLKIS